MTLILGISAFYHDSAAALLCDGKIIAAASEERFTRRKHDSRFPQSAIRSCLEFAGATPDDIDFVGFYEKPWLRLDRILETYLAYAPRGYRSFAQAIPSWLHNKLFIPRTIRRELNRDLGRKLVFCQHHESHASSAFFPSPFPEAAILTVDGVGEWATTTWGTGRANRIQLEQEIHFPHSLGLLYSAFTYFCGFKVNSGEYKLMGLAPYGQPQFADLIRAQLIRLYEDGSFHLNMDYFSFAHTLRMTGTKLEKLLGHPRRTPESPIREVDMDLAASVQLVAEEVILKLAQHVHLQTGLTHLCMAGGVALNCVANGRLLRESPFENIWVQPAAGDAGGALGAAMFIWHQLLRKPRTPQIPDAQQASCLGPENKADAVEQLLEQGAVATYLDDNELYPEVASLLSEQYVVGWVQGRMEFGPRSLGNRSILGDPRSPEMQSKMNLKIKFRESFRPFAPSILLERAHEFFEIPESSDSPYMLFTFGLEQAERVSQIPAEGNGLERVHQRRSTLPSITHLDYSARVQTVSASQFPKFHRLLAAFEAQTGCPCLINTSFNVRGEPVVNTAQEAYRCFLSTEMDALVIGNYLFLRSQQPQAILASSDRSYPEHLELD